MPDQPTGEGLDQPPMDQPPLDQPPMDQPPMDQPPMDQPPMDQPPMDQPPMDQPPLDQPPMDQPPADQSLLDEPSEPLVFEDFEDAPSLPPAPPEDLPSDTELPGVAEDDPEQLDQLSPFEQPADLPADDAELPMFPPDEDD